MIGQNLKYLFIIFSLINYLGSREILSQSDQNITANIIPTPYVLKLTDGNFVINSNTEIYFNNDALVAVEYIREILEPSTGIDLKQTDQPSRNQIQFIENSLWEPTNKEAYTLEINKDGIIISANESAGYFYAVQTLLQLLPNEIYSKNKIESNSLKLPCLIIKDVPKYSWRSFMLDSGRQYQTIEFIKRYLDYLAMLKINFFHWHLTEGQGWRIEIKKYPKLTEVGAFVAKGEEQQGFYKQEEIKEIVQYAKNRFITVVPEIELPGHSEAALIAYPEYTCFGKTPETVMEYSSNLFCGGNEMTYLFLQNILNEVCELFPGEYIHLGGDEAPKNNWDSCSVCQSRINQEDLQNSHELQVYFSARLANFLKQKNKKVILWGDIIEQPSQKLPDNVIIYWWNYRRKSDIAYKVAMQNNYTIICGTNYYTYLNFPVTPWSQYKPDRTFDIKTAYEKNPSDFQTPNKLVLGMGTCLWTDWNVKMNMIDKRVFPRIFVMAEQMWNRNDKIPFDKFYEIVKSQYKKLQFLNVDFGPGLESEITNDFNWN
jgi:N-acetyl-beta-hexosaminidase